MQRFLILTGFIVLGLFGLSEQPRKPDADQLYTAGFDSSFSSPVIPAVLYSDSNNELRTSGGLVEVVARRRRHGRRVVVRRRKFSHSVAIVGGSAAAGAGVGALAGGPHGAIAGALVGGGAGLIYDRKTHKKRAVVRE
jgi:hypothetical protein